MPTKAEWFDFRKGDSRIITPEGYILIYCPSHPHAKSKGHIYEHRYLMEKHLCRFLKSSECVHHIDGDCGNNELKNLVLLTNSEHIKLHYKSRSESVKKKQVDALRASAKKRKYERYIIECECGCGTSIINRDNKGRIKRFAWGHNQRGRHWKWAKLS